jgi:transposase
MVGAWLCPDPDIRRSQVMRLLKPQKINSEFQKLKVFNNLSTGKVRLMFQDEAGFGRINKPNRCWCLVAWAKGAQIPSNIQILIIPQYTPEMNPIEQIWKEIRKRGFKNELFSTLKKVVDRLCDTINTLSTTEIKSITGRDWIMSICSS